jgi:endonuclease/exonuclease/phosphatase family metal-dependent hydrolase
MLDAWDVAHPGEPHASTFKIYEKDEPGQPELHCDFIYIGEELRARVRDIRVDRQTQASDHQPVILTLG